MSYLRGNCADTTSPPGLFKGWLVGPLEDWSGKPPELAAEKATLAAACAQLSTHGARAGVGFKFSKEAAGQTSPHGRVDEPGINTLGLLIYGHMRIELLPRQGGSPIPCDLMREGDYLSWPSSTYNHRWIALAESLMVTLRWSEAIYPTEGTPNAT